MFKFKNLVRLMAVTGQTNKTLPIIKQKHYLTTLSLNDL